MSKGDLLSYWFLVEEQVKFARLDQSEQKPKELVLFELLFL